MRAPELLLQLLWVIVYQGVARLCQEDIDLGALDQIELVIPGKGSIHGRRTVGPLMVNGPAVPPVPAGVQTPVVGPTEGVGGTVVVRQQCSQDQVWATAVIPTVGCVPVCMASARAGHEVVADIPRVFGIHMSRDRVKAQELVTPEAVVAADPSHGGGAVAHGRPEALLCGFCRGVPEPGVGALEEEDALILAFSTVTFHCSIQWGWDSRKLLLERPWIFFLLLWRVDPDLVPLDEKDSVVTTAEGGVHGAGGVFPPL